MTDPLVAPFPYFGGKRIIAPAIWEAFGDVRSYVEPFAGSLAVLLGRPTPFTGPETVNDADGLLANFWRATAFALDDVIEAAEWPVNEADLHARHLWLVGNRERITEHLMGDAEWCDPKAAGWWVWGISSWTGSGWCSGSGPWRAVDGEMVDVRQLPHLGDDGRGVHRQLPHLGNDGRGVHRQLPHLGNDGRGVTRQRYWLETLRERMRNVRVCCGDWSRVCGPSVTHPNAKVAAILLDPPYAVSDRSDCYAVESRDMAHDVRQWAIEHGDDPAYRIALCGYEGEHEMPETWRKHEWEQGRCYAKSSGNYTNSKRERVWFSPHCLRPARESRQLGLSL